jgi:exodeoxyribonuclease V gamma subunit
MLQNLRHAFSPQEIPVFKLYHSNQLDVLKSVLVHEMTSDPLNNPFDAEHILVQSPGMSQWLKMALAQDIGIAANLEFPLPATFIWRMFTQVLEKVPTRSEFNKDAMTWRLWQLLPDLLDDLDFAALKSYLLDDDQDVKRYQLAEKIADLFDQYLVYRPDWIEQWERNEPVIELKDDDLWQRRLWKILYDHTLSLGLSHYHRANMYRDFIANLTAEKAQSANLPKRLFVFGIASLPPKYLEALVALGEHIDVHLMLTNPCRYYWGDIRDRQYLMKLEAKARRLTREGNKVSTPLVKFDAETYESCAWDESVIGNSLLASMGKMGRDNLALLSEISAPEIDAFSDLLGDSLLSRLQLDVLNLEERQDDALWETSEHKFAIKKDDFSFSVHHCHSAMREVEVLHDQLLRWFDADTSLTPRDVIVMVADINAYSPAIQSVFANAPFPRFIPFSISDRTADQENPILLAFLTLLSLPERRCTASELLELLEVPAVMAKFGFDESQFEIVKRWAEESGVRWGLDPHTAEEFNLPKQAQNTWLFGIRRMLLGYAMPADAGLFEGMAAYDEVQGLEAALAGQLAAFVDTLLTYQGQLSQSMSPLMWHQTLLGILDDFFLVDLDGEILLTTLRERCGRLVTQLEQTQVTEVSPEIIRQYMQENLANARISQRFLAGQVNFCTLMPMRSIPFKVVCLLGMNEGAYPRHLPPEGFDLMEGRWRAGDRSRRDDDRYLFLEAILSAEQHLYISYVANSIQDNQVLSPSVLVNELLDYCGHNFCLEGDETLLSDDSALQLRANLCHAHSLVPFSPMAFQGALASYAKEWLPVAKRTVLDAVAFDAAPLSSDDKIAQPLAEFQRFWRLPVQYFFERRLKVIFPKKIKDIEDDEPFILDNLERYNVRDRMLEKWVKAVQQNKESQSEIESDVKRDLRAMGRLPIGDFGQLSLDREILGCYALWAILEPLIARPKDDVSIQLTVESEQGELILEGWLGQVFDVGLVRYRTGRIRASDKLRAWIDHLCWHCVGGQGQTHMVGVQFKDKQWQSEHCLFMTLTAEAALIHLKALVAGFLLGGVSPMPYWPETALEGLALFDGVGLDEITEAHLSQTDLDKMMVQFEGSDFKFAEGSDPYIRRVWPEWREEWVTLMLRCSLPILRPMVAHLTDVEED